MKSHVCFCRLWCVTDDPVAYTDSDLQFLMTASVGWWFSGACSCSCLQLEGLLGWRSKVVLLTCVPADGLLARTLSPPSILWLLALYVISLYGRRGEASQDRQARNTRPPRQNYPPESLLPHSVSQSTSQGSPDSR